MNYKLDKLSNGLRLLTVPMPGLESATVTVWVQAGSRNEDDKNSGLSHFLEHMAFKGGRKYPSAKAVSEAIDSIGGEFNAATSKDYTEFYVRIRTKLLERAFDVLSDIVLSPTLKDEDIERERGVIIEEINLYEDTPVRRIWDLFEQLIFEGHPLGRDTIGTKATIRSLKRDNFVQYRKKFYYAKNMLITVAGGVKQEDVLKLSEKYFGAVVRKVQGKLSQPARARAASRVKLSSKKIEQAHILVGFPAEALGAPSRFSDAIVETMLGGGMSSRLFLEVREKRGLAYSVRSDIERFKDAGYFAVYAGVDPKKAEEAIAVILDQLYGLSNNTFPPDSYELTKAKEFVNGHLALSLEDTRAVNDFFGHEQLLLNKVLTPEQVFENINKVTIDSVYASAKKIFNPKKVKLCIIGPFKSQARFEKLLA